jgi:hypothetical protein
LVFLKVSSIDQRVADPDTRQPDDQLLDHGLAKIEEGRSALAVQAHVDGQAQRFAAPGWPDAQSEHDQVQPVPEHPDRDAYSLIA